MQNASRVRMLLKNMVGPWGLEPQTSTVKVARIGITIAYKTAGTAKVRGSSYKTYFLWVGLGWVRLWVGNNLHASRNGKHPRFACPITGLTAGISLPEKDRQILLAAMGARTIHLITGDLRHFGPYFGKKSPGNTPQRRIPSRGTALQAARQRLFLEAVRIAWEALSARCSGDRRRVTAAGTWQLA